MTGPTSADGADPDRVVRPVFVAPFATCGDSMNAVVALALLAPAADPEPAAPDVTDSVRTGLKWLAAQQRDDGSWSGTLNGAPTTITAIAGLAFLMEGSTPKSGPYAPNLRKALAWFEKKAGTNGMLASNGTNETYQYVPSHANALLFLVCVHDVDDDPERARRIAPLIEKAVTFVVGCQTSRGGWGFISARDGNDYDDGYSTATVLQALFAARRAGFDVPKSATDKGVRYLVNSTNRDGGVIYSIYGGAVPRGNDGQPLHTAGAAAGLLMTDGARPEVLAKWVRNAHSSTAPQLRDLRNTSYVLHMHYHMARAAYALGESGHARLEPDARGADLLKWSAYRATAFKAVKAAQGKDGGWADPSVGPTYSTALALVILQLDNGYLPAFSR